VRSFKNVADIIAFIFFSLLFVVENPMSLY
jgi:hypothetical protein